VVLGALLMERRRRREREGERERGRGIDPNHFFPHIFLCVSLSLSLSLEFRVTNTLDPQKKRRKIFCVSPHNSERTPLTPTPLCCGGFVFCVVQTTTLAKERERERETQQRRRRDFGLCANPKLRCCGEKDTCDDGTRLLENSLSMKTRDDICVV